MIECDVACLVSKKQNKCEVVFLSTCSRNEGQDQAQSWAFRAFRVTIMGTFPKSWYPQTGRVNRACVCRTGRVFVGSELDCRIQGPNVSLGA